MTVESVDTAVVVRKPAQSKSGAAHGVFDVLKVGQELDLRVLRRLSDREYFVVVAGERHVVESSVELAVGAHVKAAVTAVGDRLTLRYIDSLMSGGADAAPADPDLVVDLAQRHGVALSPREHAELRAAAGESRDPTRMVLSGLYLGKLGLPFDARAMQALYAAQVDEGGRRLSARPAGGAESSHHELLVSPAFAPRPSAAAPGAGLPADAVQIDGEGDSHSVERLQDLLADAFDDAAAARSGLGGSGGDADEREAERRVRGMLNLPDGGSIGYRYATLPLLIGGELTELQIALFAPRREDGRTQRVKRLVMTLDAPHLKQIRIEAKSVDERIAVAIDATTPAAVEALAAHEPVVRELLAHLNWSVEAVSYGVNLPPDRAARRIVDHVLSSGTVDEAY